MDAADSPAASSPPASPLTVMSSTPSPPGSPEAHSSSSSPSLSSLPHLDLSKRYPSPSLSGGASPAKQPSDETTSERSENGRRKKQQQQQQQQQIQPPRSLHDDDSEQARPVKRRRIGGPSRCTWTPSRGPQYLDLRRCVHEGRRLQDDLNMARLIDALRRKSKIVVIAGAGISVSAGIPDFRSASGLFKTLRSQQRLKASGKHLFDASVYKHDDSTESFHKMVRDLAQLTRNAKPTPFHHMLASIAEEGRLLRLYSQNVDCIETSMKPLETSVPLNCKGPWPKTIQLHGGLEKMVCTKCGHLAPFDASLFEGPEPPPCRVCTEDDLVRTAHAGKRSHGIGRMRPRIVLYNEYNPDEEAIGMVSTADLRSRPDAVIVVGTSLKIPGVRRLVKEMCQVTKGRADGFTAWINVDPEPAGPEFKDCWDLVVRAECDDVATLVDLPRWNDRRGLDDSAEVDEASEQVFQRNLVEIPLAEKESDLTKMRSARNKAAAERLQSKLLGQDVGESTGILTPGSTPKMRGKTLPAIKPSFLSLVKPARVRTIVKSETSSESESTQKKATKRAPPKKPRKATQAVRKQGETLRNVFQVTKKVAGPVDTKPSSVRPPTSSPFALAFEAPRSPLQGSYARSKGLRDDAVDAADSGSQQQRQQLADLAPAPVILPTPPSSHPRSDRSDFSLRPSQSHEYSPSPAGARAPSFSRADFAISASSTSPSHRDNGPTPGNLFPSSPFRTASGGMTGHFSLSPFRTGPAHTVPSPSSKHYSPQPAATRPFARSPFAAPTASTSAPQEPPRQQQDKQSRGFVQSSVLHFMGLLGGRPRTPPPASSGGSKFGGDSVELASSPLSSPPRTPRTPNTVMAVESICH